LIKGEALPTDVSFEPLPLVIGVTGHRDLRKEDIDQLKKRLHAVFDRLEDDYANPAGFLEETLRRFWPWPGPADRLKASRRRRPGATPMIVLSALAEGADQLVAEVARDRELRVIAPLPLPPEEYCRDFEVDPVKPGALDKFYKWMAHPGVQTLFVGYDKENGVTAENVRFPVRHNRNRELQYRRAGAFIARHCDVLIALWDGKKEEGDATIGGTAEIVDFKRNGIPLNAASSPRACLDAPEIGPVIHIVTPRASKEKDETPDAVKVERWGVELVQRFEKERNKKEKDAIEPAVRRWESFEPPIRLSREFNHEATRCLAPRNRSAIRQSLEYLFGVDHGTHETIDRGTAAALQARAAAPRYCDLYAVADTLAGHWQKNRFWIAWMLLFWFGFAAFACFEAYSHLASIAHHNAAGAHPPPAAPHDQVPFSDVLDLALLYGYGLFFAAAVAVYVWATWRQHQERFLDYRALAEALRVAVFWRLLGIDKAADAYPIKLPRELAWVKTCLLGQELFDAVAEAGGATRPPLDEATSYDLIRQIWICGQFEYFKKAAKKHEEHAKWREGLSRWVLRTGAFLAFLLLLLVSLNVFGVIGPGGFHMSRDDWFHEVFLFAIGVLPGGAAILVGYCEKLAFNAQARQYDRMVELFSRAREILPSRFPEQPADQKRVRRALRELGDETMRDNAEWVSTYRERRISVPHS
jgi:hypothetical protein